MINKPYAPEIIVLFITSIIVFSVLFASKPAMERKDKEKKEQEEFLQNHCQITEKFLGNADNLPSTTYKCDDGVVYVK